MKDNLSVVRPKEMIYTVKKHRVLIIFLFVVFTMLGAVLFTIDYLRCSTKNEYKITSSIAVVAQRQSTEFSSGNENPNSLDIKLAEEMAQSVIYVCRSDKVLNAAVQSLDLIGVTSDRLRRNLKFSQYDKTQIIEISLIWNDSQEGMQILQSITNVLPEALIDTLKIGNVAVVNDPKVIPDYSSQKFKIIFVPLFGIIGIMIGVMYALIKVFFYPTVVDDAAIEEEFGLDIYGHIMNEIDFELFKGFFSNSDYRLPASIEESIASIAYVLNYHSKDKKHSCYYITSSIEGEGKTSITAILGLKLAAQHKKVLLMDLDIKNPCLTSLFLNNIDNNVSINAVINRGRDVNESIVHINNYIDILPTVLEEEKLSLTEDVFKLIESLKESYDIILIDTSPVGIVSDALALNSVVDNVLFVVSFDNVLRESIKLSLDKLRHSGMTQINGCIVNKVSSNSSFKKYISEHDRKKKLKKKRKWSFKIGRKNKK